jgi:peptidoglycan/LPS O-acetylase OafA/YrhL
VSAPPADDPHQNQFNLVRLWLSLVVLFSHCFELIDRGRTHEPFYRLTHSFTAGDLAVDGFFVLSGFLIWQSWTRDPHPARYLARRALRIYPALLVTTLLCGLVLGPLYGGGASRYFAAFDGVAFTTAALTLREPAVPPVFVGLPYTDVNGSMWTIQYEFMCYVLVAVAGLLIRRARLFWWAVALGAAGLDLFGGDALGRIHFLGSRYLLGDTPSAFMRFLVFFAAGALWFLHAPRLRLSGILAVAVGIATAVSLCHPVAAELALPTLGACGLLAIASRPPSDSPFQRFVQRNDLSYGIYLLAWPIQQIWIRHFHLQSPWLLMPLALPSVAVCAALSWRWIESPALGWKPPRRRP